LLQTLLVIRSSKWTILFVVVFFFLMWIVRVCFPSHETRSLPVRTGLTPIGQIARNWAGA